MRITIADHLSGQFDAVVRFVKAGCAVSFSDPGLQAAYAAVYSGDRLTLGHRELRTLRLPLCGGFADVLLAGFDSSVSAPFDDFRAVVAAAGTQLNRWKATRVVMDRVDALDFAAEDTLVGQLACTLPLSEYRFDSYRSEKEPHFDRDLVLMAAKTCKAAADEGLVLAESIAAARDLVNELADVLTPEELARRAARYGQQYGFSAESYDREACEGFGMGLFLAVAKGSPLPPRLIVMRWNGGAPDEPPIGLVGKGITYDSGGLSIKTSSMESMRFDMNGAAAVIGAMCAIARQKLPRNVVAVVAACENAVDGTSYRNGDVLRSMNGKTVFVQNTDAEGRLSMADAMTYCIRTFHPSELLEVAGLTGSVCNFYGNVCAAALTNTPAMFERIHTQSPVTGEKYAAMPFYPEYRALLSSPYADLNNAPKGGPGGILAGFFLEAFCEDTPFLHIDFGAMPFTGKRSDGQPEGGTGFGVKTLYRYVKSRCGSALLPGETTCAEMSGCERS